MSAAIAARRHGLTVRIVDDQPTPGGQIWRSVELAARRDDILGPTYVEGRSVAETFRASGAIYQPGCQLWKIEPGFRAFVSCDRQAQVIDAKTIILATGAQERPVPFPGWTLPGVLTVGGAQILLKNAGQIPAGKVWIAGSGPLPLLYAVQLLRAGGQVAGYLDTTPPGQWIAALRHLPRALRASTDLVKGLRWTVTVGKHAPVTRNVVDVEALGDERIEALRYRTHDGKVVTAEASTLLVHEGVVPNIHPAMALDCQMVWNSDQDCFAPVVDLWGESSRDGLYIVGDSAGIAGAKAAQLRGALAALGIIGKLDRARGDETLIEARAIRGMLRRELAARPFLDALFKPRSQLFAPSDETIVCRCEEITAGQLRALATIGRPGPNQLKAASRAGMGPCQGRQCGYSVTHLLSAAQNRQPVEVGYFHIRAPLKPVTLGELATLDHPAASRSRLGGGVDA